jgi:type II secretory pathway component PulC
MPKLSREYLLASILAGLAAVLGLVLAIEWVVVDRERSRALAIPPAKATAQPSGEAAEAGAIDLPSLDDYKQMADRPLFMESRRPGAEPAAPEAAPPPQTPLNLKLMGIVFTPQGKKALLADAKGKYNLLKVQGVLDNWTLIEVKADQVILQQGEERKPLDLLKKRPNSPPGSAAAPHPAMPPRPGPLQRPLPPRPQPFQPPVQAASDDGEDDGEADMPEEEDIPEEDSGLDDGE